MREIRQTPLVDGRFNFVSGLEFEKVVRSWDTGVFMPSDDLFLTEPDVATVELDALARDGMTPGFFNHFRSIRWH